ncbi:MBL fold metallo-hydrolase [Sphingomonas psychrotolerans]|uniref:MBL fold metallo-hydrolase n=1 Tax=Sphingomonas psychrotolerans TaxID=1327635 RepID=A0A2K8MDP6_9SPHN|nr:MBL fold metallo-hydrolase [Sphingomonas psychrotolerans]ATY31084.1 MBL fold metallo-hydrolase [Sphingomonas psychrotolerans]
MLFETFAAGGCRSYLLACESSCAAILIDPELSLVDRYRGEVQHQGLCLRYIVDTHTHADHFSGSRELGRVLGVPIVMHRLSSAPYADLRLDDGDMLVAGSLKLTAMHTPGHTADSMCLIMENRVFTGDTLLIEGTGRTDLPTGDPNALYDSLFGRLLRLPDATLVYPAHDYKGRTNSTIGHERAYNHRLQRPERADFVAMMRDLDLAAPTHITEALRTNMNGGKTVTQLLSEAARKVPFMAMAELRSRLDNNPSEVTVLDLREKEAFEAGHITGARHLPRGQLELRVNTELPDPTAKIVTCCEFGKISTLAAATLRDLGFSRVAALEGGTTAWREAGYPLEAA